MALRQAQEPILKSGDFNGNLTKFWILGLRTFRWSEMLWPFGGAKIFGVGTGIREPQRGDTFVKRQIHLQSELRRCGTYYATKSPENIPSLSAAITHEKLSDYKNHRVVFFGTVHSSWMSLILTLLVSVPSARKFLFLCVLGLKPEAGKLCTFSTL